jgi:GntR family transcriptional repressor for pyruvate dehydrogenase complex
MADSQAKRTLIYETVIEHIKAQLINGELKPGARLPTVAGLAEQLEVGQASVREAYRILESMGILEVTQGRGTFVSVAIHDRGAVLRHFQLVEQQTLAHLLETRKLLEPGIAALAAQRAKPAEAQAILDAALEMEHLAQQGQDFIEPDVRFHELILLAAHNPIVTKIFAALSDLLLDSRRLSSRIPGATEKAIHFHKLIALAIKEGNASTAQALMYQHVDDVERDILRARAEGGDIPKKNP